MPYKLLIAAKRTQIMINYAAQWLKTTHRHTNTNTPTLTLAGGQIC